jgi:glycosyltransferase involved in cell wall biosynthesis
MPAVTPVLLDVASSHEDATGARVGYVMNGFPRLSETFIANEIHQLERLGMQLRLYVVKREDEPLVHPVVSSIRAPLLYLPHASSLSGTGLLDWLRVNLGTFWPAHARLLARHPWRWVRTASSAARLAWVHRPRPGRSDAKGDEGAPTANAAPSRWALRKVFIKEFLQAGFIADTVLRDGDVGHLHGHFCHGVATITWMASRLTGLPFSFTAHAKDIYQRELNPGRLLETKLGAARFVATCTCANAEVLRQRHPRPLEVHAIYHGLDVDLFRRDASDAQACDDAPSAVPMILAVGRLIEKKGFTHLIDACERLKSRGLSFVCRIVGEDGSAGPALRAQIQALGLQNEVRIEGAMTQDALRALYRRAHAFALPCRVMEDGDRDGFPNVLAEAMAMGVPVVSTSISGIPEMIDDGVHGLLVPPSDVDALAGALADALQRLLTEPGTHARLAAAARTRICQRFDSRRTTRELRDLLAHQLELRQARRTGVASGLRSNP